MENLSHDLFLLMVNLSQLKNRETITKTFIDALTNLFNSKIQFQLFDSKSKPDHENFPVCTQNYEFGFLGIHGSIEKKEYPVIQNASQMLAVILEKLEQEKLLTDNKKLLEDQVNKKTLDLKNVNSILKEKNREYESLNEELREKNEEYLSLNEDYEETIIKLTHQKKSEYRSANILQIGC